MLKKNSFRITARLDVKGQNLIKGVHLEGLRVLGAPENFATKYYNQGIDEIIYMDIVASLYGRSNLIDIVTKTAQNVFIPMTVGGGVRNTEDVEKLLLAGADKVAINTAAVKNPELIRNISNKFGSQCMVLSIEAKRQGNKKWEIYTDCGREHSGIDVLNWAQKAVSLGAGEILLTSVDREGTKKGLDYELTKEVADTVNVPIIASGGYGEHKHLTEIFETGADAIAIADALHFNRTSIKDIKENARKLGIKVRS